MQYRTLCGERVSALGFGAGRLPMVGTRADQRATTRLLREAIEQGINYLDVGYLYCWRQAEATVGRALEGQWRDRMMIAGKGPVRMLDSLEDYRSMFAGQLERLRTDRFDFYLLHGVTGRCWDILRRLGVLEWLQELRDAGRVRHVGFSFHDDLEHFKRILDGWDWDLCQIRLSYMDERNEAGSEGLMYAAERGVEVVIMSPLRGGYLADSLPAHVLDSLAEGREDSDDQTQRARIEAYLNAGHGACYLRDPRVARLVEDALLYFDGQQIGRAYV